MRWLPLLLSSTAVSWAAAGGGGSRAPPVPQRPNAAGGGPRAPPVPHPNERIVEALVDPTSGRPPNEVLIVRVEDLRGSAIMTSSGKYSPLNNDE